MLLRDCGEDTPGLRLCLWLGLCVINSLGGGWSGIFARPGSPDPLSPGFSFSRTPHLLSLGQPHVPTFPVIQPIIQGLFSKQGLLASPQQLEDPHHHSPSWQEVWLHPAGDPCLHG